MDKENYNFGFSAMSEHFLIIIEGSVYTWGLNHCGQLGDGTTINRNKPNKIENLENVVSVSWGYRHSMAMTQNGDVYLWGNNEHGELGDGTTENSTTPKKLKTVDNVKMIACSYQHNSMIITNYGDVYCWGKNVGSKFGKGSTKQSTPQKINNLTNIATLSCGHDYSIAITDKGDVYSWGSNNYGQLGNGSTTNSKIPQKINNLTNITSIACGYQHALALKSCGDVYSWGHNYYGQLGNGNTNNTSTPQMIPNLVNIVAVSCGYNYSMALTRDGDVYSWGHNYYGQLGVGSTNSSTPLKVNITDKVCTIACVGYNSMVFTTNGNIFIWGNNDYGQLCNGTTTHSNTPQILSMTCGTFYFSLPLIQNMVSENILSEQEIHMDKLSSECGERYKNHTNDKNNLHKILCKNDREFYIHKAIIRVRSPKLENFEELSISANLFENIIYFLYTNKIKQDKYTPNEILELLNICKIIGLNEIIYYYQIKFLKSFTKENIFDIVIDCLSLNLYDELDWAIWYIGKNKLSPLPDTLSKLSSYPNILSKLFSQVINLTIPPPNIKLKFKSLINDMKIIFSEKICTDLTIYFKNKPIEVHKFVLSQRWPYITTNIINQDSTTSTIIHNSDIPLSTFENLIKYFYVGLGCLSLKDCYWILSLQNFYELQNEKSLLQYCQKTVNFELKSNWKESLKLAVETDNEEIEKKAISLIPNTVNPQEQVSFLLSFAKENQKSFLEQQQIIGEQQRIIGELQRSNGEQQRIIGELQRTNSEQQRINNDIMKRLSNVETHLDKVQK